MMAVSLQDICENTKVKNTCFDIMSKLLSMIFLCIQHVVEIDAVDLKS